jgi:ABC-2 type transport system permease protein
MFPTMLRIGFADLMAYRAQVVIWILTTTMPLVMFAVWSTVAEQAPVGRFDEKTFAGYFLSTLVVRQLSASWIVWELNEHIRFRSIPRRYTWSCMRGRRSTPGCSPSSFSR